MEEVKKFVLGQYFTKEEIVKRVIDLLQSYKHYNKEISILEPSAGTRNFVKELGRRGFNKIKECEIDKDLTDNPQDFFNLEETNKFDLVIGNPPFTKYNVKNSYFYPSKYSNISFLENGLNKKEKMQIEKAFILKSIKHLKDKDSSIAFVLPISFFIGNKNKETKKIILDNFSTIIIYQNDKNWFEEPIPCCFAIFTNKGYGQNILTLSDKYEDKIILLYEDGKCVEEILDKEILLTEELIPKTFMYKKDNHQDGKSLSYFISEKPVKYKLSYEENNISGKNILNKTLILKGENVEDYCLAVTRVGNSSIGKSGLINPKKDILNGMFFLFFFKENYKNNKEMKELICKLINENQEHFKNITHRVGSKSIKKSDVLNFKVKI